MWVNHLGQSLCMEHQLFRFWRRVFESRQLAWYSAEGSAPPSPPVLCPPPICIPSVPLSISQSILTISGLWAGLFVCARVCVCVCVSQCVCVFHGLSESSAISCIVLPLIEPKSGPLSGMAVCWLKCVNVCVCICVCLTVFPELSVPQDHRLACAVLLLCVCVQPGATATGRPTVSKERCVSLHRFWYVCVRAYEWAWVDFSTFP